RPANMDEIKLMLACFVGKCRDDTGIRVTDDRSVVSDCADVIESGRCLIPVGVDRQIQQGPRVPSSILAKRCLDGVVRAVFVLAVTLRSVGDDSVSVRSGNTVRKALLEFAAVFFGTAVDGLWRRHRNDAVAVIGGISIAERGSEIDALGGDILLIAILTVEVDDVFDGPKI